MTLEAFTKVDPATLFGCYDEDQSLHLDREEFTDFLKDAGVTACFSSSKVKRFSDEQFDNADANSDGKISLKEFEAYLPLLIDYARMMKMRVKLPWRMEDEEYLKFAGEGRAKLLASKTPAAARARLRRPLTPEEEAAPEWTDQGHIGAPPPFALPAAAAHDWRGGSQRKEEVVGSGRLQLQPLEGLREREGQRPPQAASLRSSANGGGGESVRGGGAGGKGNAGMMVSDESRGMIQHIRSKVEQARVDKRRLQDKLRELLGRRDVLMKQGLDFRHQQDAQLDKMEDRLAELQRIRDEARRKREEVLRKNDTVLKQALSQVRAIPKRSIQEMKAMRNPPHCVRRALEAVYVLLEPPRVAEALIAGSSGAAPSPGGGGKESAARATPGGRKPSASASEKLGAMAHAGQARRTARVSSYAAPAALEWDQVIARICKPDLVDVIANFRPETTSLKVLKHLQQHYVQDPKMAGDHVEHASKACASLWKWVCAMLDVGPVVIRCVTNYSEAEERDMQDEIQKLLKEIAKHNLGRMDSGLFSSLQVDRVKQKTKTELISIAEAVRGVEMDIVAMQGVIEKGTRLEKEILSGGKMGHLVWDAM